MSSSCSPHPPAPTFAGTLGRRLRGRGWARRNGASCAWGTQRGTAGLRKRKRPRTSPRKAARVAFRCYTRPRLSRRPTRHVEKDPLHVSGSESPPGGRRRCRSQAKGFEERAVSCERAGATGAGLLGHLKAQPGLVCIDNSTKNERDVCGKHSATHGAPPTTPVGAYRETEESERTRTRAASEND